MTSHILIAEIYFQFIMSRQIEKIWISFQTYLKAKDAIEVG